MEINKLKQLYNINIYEIYKKLNLCLSNQKQYQYYCGVGGQNIFERDIANKILDYSLYAGLKVSGLNAEVAVSQWELQIGPVEGINCAHQIHLLRYIITRTSEEYNCCVDFHPKPTKIIKTFDDISEWNGSGLHTNFSTESMRRQKGYEHIIYAIEKLGIRHKEHMKVYGEYNELRMTGKCETSSIDKFTYGIADRTSSIRIPFNVVRDGCGYFEDRRPASNADPYLVCSTIYETCCL